MNTLIISTVCAASLLASSAHAIFVTPGDAGIYTSGFYGVSSPSDSAFGDDEALRLGVGFQLNKSLAIEVNYVDLGAYVLKDRAELDRIAARIEGDLQETYPEAQVGAVALDVVTTGLEVSLLGDYRLTDAFSIYGRVGLFSWNSDKETDVTVALASRRGTITFAEPVDDGIDVVYGMGAAYQVTQTLSLNIEWSKYTTADTDNRIAGVGVRWYF